MIKWVRRLMEIIGLWWGWRKEDHQEMQKDQEQAQQKVEARIQEIDHESQVAKARVDRLPTVDLDAELDRLQQRAKDHGQS
jgi:hypothetical protein